MRDKTERMSKLSEDITKFSRSQLENKIIRQAETITKMHADLKWAHDMANGHRNHAGRYADEAKAAAAKLEDFKQLAAGLRRSARILGELRVIAETEGHVQLKAHIEWAEMQTDKHEEIERRIT